MIKDIEIKGPNVEFKKARTGGEAYCIEIKEIHGLTYQDYFELHNNGNEKFVLRDIQRNCGCANPVYEKLKEILPGESYKVPFTFSVDKGKASAEGIYTKYLYILSTLPEDKPIAIHFNCTILPDEG